MSSDFLTEKVNAKLQHTHRQMDQSIANTYKIGREKGSGAEKADWSKQHGQGMNLKRVAMAWEPQNPSEILHSRA